MEQPFMDAQEAWADFYERVRPAIWSGLSRNERRDIHTAQRDFLGLRKDRHGATVRLGADRVARLLERFAPGQYGVERVVRFWVNGGQAPDHTPNP